MTEKGLERIFAELKDIEDCLAEIIADKHKLVALENRMAEKRKRFQKARK